MPISNGIMFDQIPALNQLTSMINQTPEIDQRMKFLMPKTSTMLTNGM